MWSASLIEDPAIPLHLDTTAELSAPGASFELAPARDGSAAEEDGFAPATLFPGGDGEDLDLDFFSPGCTADPARSLSSVVAPSFFPLDTASPSQETAAAQSLTSSPLSSSVFVSSLSPSLSPFSSPSLSPSPSPSSSSSSSRTLPSSDASIPCPTTPSFSATTEISRSPRTDLPSSPSLSSSSQAPPVSGGGAGRLAARAVVAVVAACLGARGDRGTASASSATLRFDTPAERDAFVASTFLARAESLSKTGAASAQAACTQVGMSLSLRSACAVTVSFGRGAAASGCSAARPALDSGDVDALQSYMEAVWSGKREKQMERRRARARADRVLDH